MKIHEHFTDQKEAVKPAEPSPHKEDFSHIKGDVEDFIFFFTESNADTKKHSEK